jgi:heme/copper-type cytochrome/quinol oxidase subunit 2
MKSIVSNEGNRLRTKEAGIIIGLALVGIVAAACGGGSSSSANQIATMNGNAPWMTAPLTSSSTGAVQVIKLTIQDITTPEGSEPAYIGPNGKGAADLFSVEAGKEIQVVVQNKDSMPHTFTVSQLGLNITIAPESTTKFSFAAKTAGTYIWYCSIPCGSWVMSNDGYMKGDFKVA